MATTDRYPDHTPPPGGWPRPKTLLFICMQGWAFVMGVIATLWFAPTLTAISTPYFTNVMVETLSPDLVKVYPYVWMGLCWLLVFFASTIFFSARVTKRVTRRIVGK